MTKTTLLSALLLSCLSIHSVNVAQASEKMTYEKAMKSDRATFHHKTIPLQETIDTWDRYVTPPKEEPNGSGAGQLKEVWTGSAVSVPVTWGNGDYYIEITFGHKNQGGSAWLTIDDSSIKKNVAIPSPFQYEGNYHILYETGTLSAQSDRASGTPKITHISKLPSK